MFQWDSPLMRVLRTITNYIFVTILMALCSIPLVTAGAAFCAGYDTVRRCFVLEQGPNAAKTYFKSFARNFRQSTVIWVICAAVLTLFWQGIRVMEALGFEGVAPGVLQGVLVLGMVFCAAILLCALASAARFRNSVGMLLRNSLLLCVMNLWRFLLLMAVWAIAAIAVIAFRPLVLITPALAVFYWYRCMETVFSPHLPEEERDKPPEDL